MSPQLAAAPPPPALPGAAPGPEDDVHLSLRDHLLELRKRLFRAVLATSAGMLICWNLSQKLFAFLMAPVFAALPEGEKALHYSSAVDPFFIYLKVSLYGGFLLALPYIFWQLWAFIAPGLYRKERRTIFPFVIAGTLFFVGGITFCYRVILWPAFDFLLKQAGPNMMATLMMDSELGLVVMLMMAFGIIFELPLVLTFLAMIGLIDHKFLIKYRRHAIVLNLIIAAVITPTGDPINLGLMAVPMMLCYELGIVGAWVFGKKRKAEPQGVAPV